MRAYVNKNPIIANIATLILKIGDGKIAKTEDSQVVMTPGLI